MNKLDRSSGMNLQKKKTLYIDTKPLSNLMNYCLEGKFVDSDQQVLESVYEKLKCVITSGKYDLTTTEAVITEALYFLTKEKKDKIKTRRNALVWASSVNLKITCCGPDCLDKKEYVRDLSYPDVSLIRCELSALSKTLPAIIISTDQNLIDTAVDSKHGGVAYNLYALLQHPNFI